MAVDFSASGRPTLTLTMARVSAWCEGRFESSARQLRAHHRASRRLFAGIARWGLEEFLRLAWPRVARRACPAHSRRATSGAQSARVNFVTYRLQVSLGRKAWVSYTLASRAGMTMLQMVRSMDSPTERQMILPWICFRVEKAGNFLQGTFPFPLQA